VSVHTPGSGTTAALVAHCEPSAVSRRRERRSAATWADDNVAVTVRAGTGEPAAVRMCRVMAWALRRVGSMRTLTWSAPSGADSVTGGPKVVRAGGSDTRIAVAASTYTASELASADATMTIVSTRCIAVTGMTCDHCASAVRAEISKLPGVTGVDVDVDAGAVRVCGDPLPGDVSLREAVEEAGYEFAG
jgi:copper chaperone